MENRPIEEEGQEKTKSDPTKLSEEVEHKQDQGGQVETSKEAEESSDPEAPSNEQEQAEDFKSKFYYLAAEMENLKKRFEREKEGIIKYGLERIMGDLLPVLDNFERVTMAIENEEDAKIKNLKIGIDMVKKQFLDALSAQGLEPIEVNCAFDPNVHEAMGEEESEDKRPGEIVREFLKGHKLNGRVLRAAKVFVAKAPSSDKNKKGKGQ